MTFGQVSKFSSAVSQILEISSSSPEFQKVAENLFLSINVSCLSKLACLKVNRETADFKYLTFPPFTIYFAFTKKSSFFCLLIE